MRTQKEVRASFWSAHEEFRSEFRTRKKQNEYNCTIRSYFVSWVDYLVKNGEISEKLASIVTL